MLDWNQRYRERVRWSGYGLLVGLALGLVLGWFFHGIVGILLRIFFLVVILAPFVAAVLFWRRVNRREVSDTSVTDVAWREVERSEGNGLR